MAAYYNEYDPFAAQWLRNLIAAGHLPPGDVDSRSILDVQPEDLAGYDQCHFFAGIGIWGYGLRRVGWPDDRAIWSGSCPCQPFSAAGRGLGFDDERHLWPAWYHLITQRRPARIVGEQVASKDGLEWLDLVSTDLENAGYAFGAADLCAAGFAEQGRDGGGFHLRQRQYFVATLEGLDDPAGARRFGAQQDAESDSRDETRLRGPCERGPSGGLEYASGERRGKAGNEHQPERPEEWDCRAGHGDGMADPATNGRRQEYADARGGRFGDSAEGRPAGFGSGVGGFGMGDSGCPRAGRDTRTTLGEKSESGCSGVENGHDGGNARRPAGSINGMADPECAERGAQTDIRGHHNREARERGESSNRGSQCGGAALPASGRTERQHRVSDNDARRSNANLVYCRDGRWRPIEPGAFPLAYAVPLSMGAMRAELRAVCAAAGFSERDLAAARKYRAGALKAFGNALDGETVVAFLEAALPLAP